MSTYTPFEQEVLSKLNQLTGDVSELKSDVRDAKSHLTSLEDIVLDTREAFRAGAASIRALLNQAFEYISDQMASKDQQPIPSMIFRSRQRDMVNH